MITVRDSEVSVRDHRNYALGNGLQELGIVGRIGQPFAQSAFAPPC